MYQGFLEAHRRAVALSGLTPDHRTTKIAPRACTFSSAKPRRPGRWRALPNWEKASGCRSTARLIMLYAAPDAWTAEAFERVEIVRAIVTSSTQLQLPASVFVRFLPPRILPGNSWPPATRSHQAIPICLRAGRSRRPLESSGDGVEALRNNTAWPPSFVRIFRSCGRKRSHQWTAAAARKPWRSSNNWRNRATEYVDVQNACACLDEQTKRFQGAERAASENSCSFVLDVDLVDPLAQIRVRTHQGQGVRTPALPLASESKALR